MTLVGRGSSYHLKRRVPARFSGVEPRAAVWIALKTDSPSEAERRSLGAWDLMVSGWGALLAGNSADVEVRYKAARDLAQARGFRFLPVARVAALPITELMDRIDAAMTADGKIDKALAPGILGAAQRPDMRLSGVLDLYWTLAADKAQGKSADQVRRWRNPLIKAFRNLIAVIGDVKLTDLTPEDLLDFRSW